MSTTGMVEIIASQICLEGERERERESGRERVGEREWEREIPDRPVAMVISHTTNRRLVHDSYPT
jgi:hypothetical protein